MRPSEPMDTMTPHAAVQILQKLRSSCGSLMLAMAPALLLPSVEVTHNYYPYRRSESWDFFPSHSAAWDWPQKPLCVAQHAGNARCTHRPQPSPALYRSGRCRTRGTRQRSEEHTSELQSLMRISYDAFCS